MNFLWRGSGMWALSVLTGLGPAVGRAQGVPTVFLGERARVTWTAGAGRRQEIGRAVMDRDTLRLRVPTSEIVSVAAGRVLRLEVSTGRRRRWWEGGLIGLAVGATAGALAGNASHSACQREGGDACFLTADRRSNDVLFGMAVWGVPGVIIGTGVGALIRTDRWADRTALLRPIP